MRISPLCITGNTLRDDGTIDPSILSNSAVAPWVFQDQEPRASSLVLTEGATSHTDVFTPVRCSLTVRERRQEKSSQLVAAQCRGNLKCSAALLVEPI